MMRSLIMVGVLIVSGFSLAHEHSAPSSASASETHLMFSQGAVHAHVQWVHGPALDTESVLQISWRNGRDHSPLQLKNAFEVVIWMPDMGHGSAPTKIEPVLNEDKKPLTGVYRVSNIQFIMGGQWQVKIIVEDEAGMKETQIIDVLLEESESNHHHGHHH